jgi:hypothetical protein
VDRRGNPKNVPSKGAKGAMSPFKRAGRSAFPSAIFFALLSYSEGSSHSQAPDSHRPIFSKRIRVALGRKPVPKFTIGFHQLQSFIYGAIAEDAINHNEPD